MYCVDYTNVFDHFFRSYGSLLTLELNRVRSTVRHVYFSDFFHKLIVVYEQFKELLGPVGAGIGLNGGALCLTKLGYRHVWEDVAEQIHHVNQVSPSGNISRQSYIKNLDFKNNKRIVT